MKAMGLQRLKAPSTAGRYKQQFQTHNSLIPEATLESVSPLERFPCNLVAIREQAYLHLA